MQASEYIQALASNGRYHFTTEEAVAAVGGATTAVRAQLRRLRAKGLVAVPMRGFYVIVPPEYGRIGCLPAEQFIPQLMDHLGEPYYIALLSAAQRHGAAHQRPQRFQVMVRKNRQAIECGRVLVDFIARGDLERMPVVELNTPRGLARYSTAEVTALELVGYPSHCGGLSNVATVIAELTEEIDTEKLVVAAGLSPISWSQRLGYLLELAGINELSDALAERVTKKARCYTPLRRAESTRGGARSHRWKLIINADVEPDL